MAAWQDSAGGFPQFPPDFVWGVATSAYQIEGAPNIDGKGPSVWDTFAHLPGKIVDGQTGDVACDHYHRWEQDLDLIADLGVDAYRFSVSWPRILPSGNGAVEPRGMDFYDRLVDELLDRGIAAYLTLFHWDLPQACEDRGGWLVRQTAEEFAEYAGLLGERLGDRVAAWITLNEPFVHSSFGYSWGVHAPGRTLGLAVYPVVHHLLLGHGLAVQALRTAGVSGGIGITHNLSPVIPADPTDSADVAAAGALDAYYNRHWLDPILIGREPAGMRDYYQGSDLSCVRDGDADIIAEPPDFLGVNYYNPQAVKAPGPGNPMGFALTRIEGVPRTGFDWPIVPSGLAELLTGLQRDYGDALPPIYLTENGSSWPDEPASDGRVHDTARIDCLDSHLRALHAAMQAGVDVRGYFAWTFVDNFEWADGFTQRFGLVRLDLDSQSRIPKDSYDFYRSIVSR